MNNAPLVAIGDIAEVFDGPHATPRKTSNGPVYLGIDAISNDGHLIPGQFAHLSEDDYSKWTKRVVPQESDIVFSYEATLGRCAMIPRGFRGALGRRLALVRVNRNKVEPSWLYYYFLSPSWSAFIANQTFHGSTVDRVSVENYPTYKIPLPPLEKQRAVAYVLSTIDDKIANNKKLMAELEETAQIIYDYWFTQFDFPDQDGRPYRSSGGKMVWSPELKREIPEGWAARKVIDLVSIEKGVSYTSEDLLGSGIPMISLASFSSNGTYKPEAIKTYSGKIDARRTVEANDLIMCATQQTAIDLSGRTNVIGKAILTPSIFDETTVISTDIVKLAPCDRKYAYVLEGLFKRRDIHRYIVGFANGTKIKHLDVASALSLFAAFPDVDDSTLHAFAEKRQQSMAAYSNLLRECDKLASLRDWLLPMLMNGQVRVDSFDVKDGAPPRCCV